LKEDRRDGKTRKNTKEATGQLKEEGDNGN
jgi:hypothetical protein